VRNIAEQISVVEESRNIGADKLIHYLPNYNNLPVVVQSKNKDTSNFSEERDLLYKAMYEMKKDINDLKKLTLDLLKNENTDHVFQKNRHLIDKIRTPDTKYTSDNEVELIQIPQKTNSSQNEFEYMETIEEDETLSLHEKEIEMIKKSLERNQNKRKLAAKELGISERTLYRKIKQYNL
jgi:transcriptional regulator of acetoin/glycerol metabolism